MVLYIFNGIVLSGIYQAINRAFSVIIINSLYLLFSYLLTDVAMEALNRSITIDENGDIVSNYSLLLDPSEVEEEEENGGSQERYFRLSWA